MADFPHCDPRVLREPGKCEFCDMFPALQRARIDGGTNFTGQSHPGKKPCPADAARGLGQAHQWHGNRPEPPKKHKGWIGVDLDGTLAYYEKWVSETHIGAPIAPMVQRVKRWLAEGRDVRIFTARVSSRDEAETAIARAAIENWCDEHIGQVLPVTNVKDYQLMELWDDRAVQVEKNTGAILGRSTRGL